MTKPSQGFLETFAVVLRIIYSILIVIIHTFAQSQKIPHHGKQPRLRSKTRKHQNLQPTPKTSFCGRAFIGLWCLKARMSEMLC